MSKDKVNKFDGDAAERTKLALYFNLDLAYSSDFWTLNPISLADLENRIDNFDQRVKFTMEEGTRFRGYKDANAVPYLGYRVVQYITIYEPIPRK